MFEKLEGILISLAHHIPLELFSTLASLVEEIIAPIPSPAVMMVTGSLAALQNRSLIALVPLALCGALGKLLGALVVYFFSDKLEDILTGRWGKFFGLDHNQLEAFGNRLKKDWKDYVLLTFLRALPIIPSSVVSIGCGVLKVKLRLFIISTFIGTIIRDSIYIYVGYMGAATATSLVNQSAKIESGIQIVIAGGIVVILGYLYYRRIKLKP